MVKETDMIVSAIEEARRLQGVSIAELSRRIGVDRKRLWRVLNGQREIRIEEFLALCIALRIDPRTFVSGKMICDIADRSISKRGSRTP